MDPENTVRTGFHGSPDTEGAAEDSPDENGLPGLWAARLRSGFGNSGEGLLADGRS